MGWTHIFRFYPIFIKKFTNYVQPEEQSSQIFYSLLLDYRFYSLILIEIEIYKNLLT